MPRDNSSNEMRREIRRGISFGLRRVQVFDSTERHPDPPTPSVPAALGAGKMQDTATEATANAASARGGHERNPKGLSFSRDVSEDASRN